jgi:hypothetical protein
MREELDHTRRWLINASGAAILSSAIPIDAAHAQTAATTPRSAGRATSDLPEGPTTDRTSISPHTAALADYVAGTLDRELPTAAAARTKLHILDTIAAMVSGSRLKPGAFAALCGQHRRQAPGDGDRHEYPHLSRQCGARQCDGGPCGRDRRY